MSWVPSRKLPKSHASSTRFATGALLARHEYSLAMTAKFECGMPAYAWLNNVVAVGTGEQTPTGPVYTIFSIGQV